MLLLAQLPAVADSTRTQTIQLRKGWNAVFLAVTPEDSRAEATFAGTPVEIAATYFVPARAVEFVRDPGAIRWTEEGWGVWYSESRPDGFLSSMSAIYGNRTYLLYARQDYLWNVRGTVTFEPTRWKADSFNLVGFGLDEQSPPTFKAFFGASPAHQACRIYRLVNDQWVPVNDPLRTTMRSGEAYWVFCKGGSDYQGPLSLKLSCGREVRLSGTAQVCLSLANRGADPLNVAVETVSGAQGLPLAYVVTGIGQGTMGNYLFDLPKVHKLRTLEAGGSTVVALQLQSEKMTAATQSVLLKIFTDTGMQYWVPVTGTRADLAPTP